MEWQCLTSGTGDDMAGVGDVDSETQNAYGLIDEETAERRRQALTDAVAIVGDVSYRWSIHEERIEWGAGVETVLGLLTSEQLSDHSNFASRITIHEGRSRFERILCGGRDTGEGVSYELEYCLKDDFGGERWVEDRGRWFADAEGRPATAIGVLRPIDERHRREQRMMQLSTYDDLTGLLNRVAVKERLGEVLNETGPGRLKGAFILLAIDNLALINDAFGFDVADEVILGVGQRLRGMARRSDALGRAAGNKFGLVLTSCDEDRLDNICQRLLSRVREEVISTTHGPVAATISAGAVALPRDAGDADKAMARAEEALVAAKQMHRDSYVIYTPSSEREKVRLKNISVADDLLGALNERRVMLAYQPIVDTAGRPFIHECLIRMRDSNGEVAPAGAFVPVAEKLGLIGFLDFRAMELAVETLRNYPQAQLSVNVSGRTIGDRMWRETLEAQLRAHPGMAERLVIEITETVAIHEMKDTAAFIRAFRDMGCRIAIDDFGAGYTSFRNLKTLDVDMVKIDGSYVEGVAHNPDNQVFLRTLVELAHNFNLPTIAEWVDSEEDAAILRKLGVDYFQGFMFGRPDIDLYAAGIASAPTVSVAGAEAI